MKTYVCHAEHCTHYKIGPDPHGNQMSHPTCHHPTTEIFNMVFPLKDEPAGARTCRRFTSEKDEEAITMKIEAHSKV